MKRYYGHLLVWRQDLGTYDPNQVVAEVYATTEESAKAAFMLMFAGHSDTGPLGYLVMVETHPPEEER